MYSGIRVKVHTDAGPVDLSDAVVSLSHTDAMDGAAPQTTINLPRYRTVTASSRVPCMDLIRSGALATVEALGT